jgi:pre-mRNA 3'-end-processing factor FIP1
MLNLTAHATLLSPLRRVTATKSASQLSQSAAGSQAVTISASIETPRSISPKVDSAGRVQVTLQSGKSYPEVRTSTVDVNGNPVFPPAGKPVTEIDIDADFAEQEKPWRRPGADQSDYFNYGFDEFTWTAYRLRQKEMSGAVAIANAEKKDMNNEMMMFSAAGGESNMMGPMQMGGMPVGGDMAAMNSNMMMAGPPPEFMQQIMMKAMQEQGTNDPTQLDFATVMNQMQQGGGMMGQPSIPSGPAAQQQNYGGGNWQQGYGKGGGKHRGRW